MFAGQSGLVIVALLISPILGGIVAGLFFLSVPRLRFVSPYCALVPLFSISGLIIGLVGGLRLARPYYYRSLSKGFRQSSGLPGH